MKKQKDKLFDSFINKIKENRVYMGVPPKNLKVGDIHINSRINELHYFNGKKWEKII